MARIDKRRRERTWEIPWKSASGPLFISSYWSLYDIACVAVASEYAWIQGDPFAVERKRETKFTEVLVPVLPPTAT